MDHQPHPLFKTNTKTDQTNSVHLVNEKPLILQTFNISMLVPLKLIPQHFLPPRCRRRWPEVRNPQLQIRRLVKIHRITIHKLKFGWNIQIDEPTLQRKNWQIKKTVKLLLHLHQNLGFSYWLDRWTSKYSNCFCLFWTWI